MFTFSIGLQYTHVFMIATQSTQKYQKKFFGISIVWIAYKWSIRIDKQYKNCIKV